MNSVDVPMIVGTVTPNELIRSTLDAPPPHMVYYHCLNGPCEGTPVEAPSDATVGTACAIPWAGPSGRRFAVYMLVDHNGMRGLMFMQTYQRADYAQAKVQRLTAICAGAMA